MAASAQMAGKDAASLERVIPLAPETTADSLKTPIRAQSKEADVQVPREQALFTGCLVAIGSTAIAAAAVVLIDTITNIRYPVLWPPLVGGAAGWVTTLEMWYKRLKNSDESLWRLEEWTNTDIDGNGYVGRPDPPQSPGWISIDGRRAQRERQKTEIEQWRDAVMRFCELVWYRQESGRGSGQKEMRGHALPHGLKITDELHRDIGEALIKDGLAKRHGKGWKLIAPLDEIVPCVEAWEFAPLLA
jgi:hypothetical protein